MVPQQSCLREIVDFAARGGHFASRPMLDNRRSASAD
jgi:hypothetical protein